VSRKRSDCTRRGNQKRRIQPWCLVRKLGPTPAAPATVASRIRLVVLRPAAIPHLQQRSWSRRAALILPIHRRSRRLRDDIAWLDQEEMASFMAGGILVPRASLILRPEPVAVTAADGEFGRLRLRNRQISLIKSEVMPPGHQTPATQNAKQTALWVAPGKIFEHANGFWSGNRHDTVLGSKKQSNSGCFLN